MLIKNLLKIALLWFILFAFITHSESFADTDLELFSGNTLYVSVYSNIYSAPKAVRLELAAMLSLRNTDPKNSITILKADYYDTAGKLVDSYIKKPLVLKPLESAYIYLKEYDKRGGPGANFIVKWQADKKVNRPIIETIMFSTRHGISFVCPGQIIKEYIE